MKIKHVRSFDSLYKVLGANLVVTIDKKKKNTEKDVIIIGGSTEKCNCFAHGR